MTPTEEQAEILRFGRESDRSLLISALAGAAKTSTLVLLAGALPLQPILCLAFNKKIADEMQRRMPGHVNCLTLNSLGHRTWAKTTGKRLAFNKDKSYEILAGIVSGLRPADRGSVKGAFGPILAAVGLAKRNGYVPKAFRGIANTLIERDELALLGDEDLTDFQVDLVEKVISLSIEAGYRGQVDFDDQIYLPTLFNGSFPKYPLVMADEVQDFAPLNLQTLLALAPKRFIGVGDSNQSIYGFRGADTNAMRRVKEVFSCEERTLSISFRCPRSAVTRAWHKVPHMRWAPTALAGEIVNFDRWSVNDVPEGTTVLCRNNAPLFSCALRFIRAGRGVAIAGRELGPGLIKLLKKLGPSDLSRAALLAAIDEWERSEIARVRKERRPQIADRAECLKVFAAFGATLGEAIAYAEALFQAKGLTTLMSIHKAKGLEWDDVLHLDPWRIPSKYAESPEDVEQESNLRYVAETRWKKRLFVADLENMQ